MKKKWLALFLSCTMVFQTGILPATASVINGENLVMQQMDNSAVLPTQDAETTENAGKLEVKTNYAELAKLSEDEELPFDLESEEYWTKGEKARELDLTKEDNIDDVFNYGKLEETVSVLGYKIQEVKVSVGEKVFQYVLTQLEESEEELKKAEAEELAEAFGEEFVLDEETESDNFVGEGLVSLKGSAKADVVIEVIFAEAEAEDEKDPEENDSIENDVKENETTGVLEGKNTLAADPEAGKKEAEDAEESSLLIPKFQSTYASPSGEYTFDPKTKEVTVYVTTDSNSFNLKPLIGTSDNKDPEMTFSFSYTDVNGEEQTKEATCTGYFHAFTSSSGFLNVSAKGNDLHLTATKGDVSEKYTIHVERKALISALTATDENGNNVVLTPTFNKTKTEYTAEVLDNVAKVKLKVTDPIAATFPEDSKISFNGYESADGSYELEIKPGENKVVIKAANGAKVAEEYTLTITQKSSIKLNVVTDPEDAQFCLYDANKERVYPDNGTFYLFPGKDYTYTVACEGYVGTKGELNKEESSTLNVTLDKAAESEPLPSLDAEYGGFRADANNQSVISSKTPITKESIEVKWERQMGTSVTASSGSTPVIVDNKIYTQSGGKLYMLDKETGEVLKSSDCCMNAGFNLIPVTYGDGMIFVPLGSGIQCFNASTLESLWCYKGVGSCNSPIRYEDGKIYVGFQSNNGSFVCLTTTDEDPSNEKEEKVPLWTNYGTGYWWAGAWTNEKYVFAVNQGGALMVMDKNTGETVQKIQTKASAVRSDVSYYNGRIYFSTQSGYLYSYNLTADGKVDLEKIIEPLYFGGASTCTPAVYNNRLYIGISSGSTFGEDGSAILVVDINAETGAMSKAYLVPTSSDFGYCQTSGLIINGYEEENGYVYVYFLVNSAKGSLYMVKDKPGLTAPEPETGLFYTPNHEQYCIASAVADKDGTIYLKNDSAWQFAIRRADAYLKNVEITGGNAVVDGGNDFVGSVAGHTVTVDADTTSVTMNLTANDGVDVRINNIPGAKQEVKLTSDKTEVTVTLIKGESARNYTFTILRGPSLSAVEITNNPNQGMGDIFVLDEEFDPVKTEISAGLTKTSSISTGYVWFTPENSNSKVEATAVSGVNGYEKGEALTVRTNYKGNPYAIVPFAVTTAGAQTSAVIELKVSSADGSQSRTYTITLYTNNALPKVTVGEDAIKERTNESAKITVTTNKAGTLYYLVQKADASAPDAATIQKDGKSLTAVEGENTWELTGLTKDGYKVYIVLKQEDGAVSAVAAADIAKTALLGDVNDDGYIDMIDVVQLQDAVTSETDLEASVGDMNGDGYIDMIDVVQLQDQVTKAE